MSTASAPSSPVEARIAVPGGVWRTAFSIRLSVSRKSSSWSPSTIARVGVDRELVLAAEGAELGGGVEHHLRQIDRLARGGAADVAAREQQQVGDQPAHAPRGAQRRARRVALVAVQRFRQQLEVGEHARQRRAQLVRGVGDEAALAVEHRLGLGVGVVERLQHPLQRAGELGDLVVGLGLGDRGAGVLRAGDLRRGRGERRDRLHRAAGDRRPASSASAGAGERAEHQQQLDARDRRLRCRRAGGRTGSRRSRRSTAAWRAIRRGSHRRSRPLRGRRSARRGGRVRGRGGCVRSRSRRRRGSP